jgi:hypothetical protein
MVNVRTLDEVIAALGAVPAVREEESAAVGV